MSLVVRSEFETFSPVWYENGTYRSIGGVQTVLSEERIGKWQTLGFWLTEGCGLALSNSRKFSVRLSPIKYF